MSRTHMVVRRFVVYVLFLFSFMRMAAARILLHGSLDKATSPDIRGSGAKLGFLMRPGSSMNPQYALELVGSFPYVKLVPLATKSVPVPIEVGPVLPGKGASTELQAKSKFFTHLVQGGASPEFLVLNCYSCSSCTGCSSCSACGGCSSCCG